MRLQAFFAFWPSIKRLYQRGPTLLCWHYSIHFDQETRHGCSPF